MFEVGDKVRYVPNEDSPRNASTIEGVVASVDCENGYYSVEFAGGWLVLVFSEAELVKVA